MDNQPKPTIGRQVHYALATGKNPGALRPATVVHVNPDGTVNLQVLTDGDGNKRGDHLAPLFWVPNVAFGTDHGTCRWPAREAEPAPDK